MALLAASAVGCAETHDANTLDLGTPYVACFDQPGGACTVTNADRPDSRAAGRAALSLELLVASDSCVESWLLSRRLLSLSRSTDAVEDYDTRAAGPRRVSVSLYGSDADAMWRVAKPIVDTARLEDASFAVAHAPGSSTDEKRLDLSASTQGGPADCLP